MTSCTLNFRQFGTPLCVQELRGTKDEIEEQIDSIAQKIAGAHPETLVMPLDGADTLISFCARHLSSEAPACAHPCPSSMHNVSSSYGRHCRPNAQQRRRDLALQLGLLTKTQAISAVGKPRNAHDTQMRCCSSSNACA